MPKRRLPPISGTSHTSHNKEGATGGGKRARLAKPAKPARVPLQLPTSQHEVGVDSVGRGCLFGPVVAGAVIMPTTYKKTDTMYQQIRDSKKLSAKKREELARYIRTTAVAWGLGEASAQEIDRVNILQADLNAMHRALDRCYAQLPFKHIIVDGDKFRPYVPLSAGLHTTVGDHAGAGADASTLLDPIEHVTVVKGDDLYLNVAAGSIIAKVYRDEMMMRLEARTPALGVYGLAKNHGYGTPTHIQALQQHGPSLWHRQSFGPVRNAAAERDTSTVVAAPTLAPAEATTC
jgi:ribonuclease HII